MTSRRKVVVVGGGVIGAACAHYLSEAGYSVTVVEQDRFGHGCSWANCGFICPSHVLPLAEPGAVGQALRGLLLPNSPLKIRLRFDWRLWAWFVQFARRCNEADMLEAGRACQALLRSSMSLYEQLMDSGDFDCQWQKRGLLFVYRSRERFEQYAETDRLLREQFNEPAVRHDGDAVREVEPALKPGLAGGWHYRDDAHLRPDELMNSWRRVLERRGVEVVERCSVTGFAGTGSVAQAAQTDQGELPADVFVLATGAWTPRFARQLGCRIPIQPGKGYSLTTTSPEPAPQVPLIFPEWKVAVTPLRSAYRLGSTMEFAGYDSSLPPKRLKLLRRAAEQFLQAPYGEQELDRWYGWRPMTYDGLPVIDRSPRFENVWVAAGHNMLGMSMAPATGKLLAELIDGRPPHVDPTPYALTRF